ncbi:MAG: glycoside hydrolase family 3 N-terminal domain-containing protein [Thermodesulfobacteriota bacterium]
MTLKEKIGRLFILGFKGSSINPDDPIGRDITKHHLGGVILFDRLLALKATDNNIISTDQVQSLIKGLQDLSSFPLFIAVDQEGGQVRRLREKHGVPATPTAESLGSGNDPALTAMHSRTCSAILKKLGFNFNLAPVVDLNSFSENPVIGKLERSFSPDPQTVFEHAAAWIEEHRKNGLISCPKHFPGHGSSRTDSHLGFTDISNYWGEEELLPYQKLIKAGLADAIMTGHLFHQQLDSDYPATLSKKTIKGMLRGRLGFEGVVVSDDLQMRAIGERYPMDKAVTLALQAGVDLLVIGNNLRYEPDILGTLIQSTVRNVENGILAESLIDRAFERVEHLRAKIS